ncbi:unnamed protein product [Cuscuta epithymum]|uniref:Protein kinase domain-containing protein n=1 Tax=Cuscuta epithymum TaxID=186058 RepID=A0AAV0CIZ2_9ASTE|nr:unnamed protein product [Cuscuta epithymum]CAH9148955.1 unnamed protein product [Cuscuta epithymum]
MDQFCQIGEVVGSMQALMVLKHDIVINTRQCCFLFDIYVQAFNKISDEIKQHLRLDERGTKWKPLERPMRELYRIFKEGESYIMNCIDIKNQLGKAISIHSNRDCVELHIHNLLSCFVVVIEAIEAAAEISGGLHEEDVQKRRLALMNKYDTTKCNDPTLFQWKYGNQYLVSREICSRLECIWNEDRWLLLEMLRKIQSNKLAEKLIMKLSRGLETDTMLLPTSLLLEASDYHVKRRIGSGGSHLKEIQWLGESFALRTFYGDIEVLRPEIAMAMSMSHPNVLQYHCGFYDESRKEGFLVMDLMSKSLDIFMKENSGQRRRMSFSIPVAVDIMLQIARGVEYLHSRSLFHGELNPSNILLRPTTNSCSSSLESYYFHVKVAGFGLSLLKSQYTHRSCPRVSGIDPVVWYAPEVVVELSSSNNTGNMKYSEKADVYSFGMLCFQILTGKAPFEDGVGSGEIVRPLQGDKMVHSLMAGERPLFPHPFPKFLMNLVRKCWQTSPNTRPGFSSICRILRYMKKVLVINPEHGQPGCPPPLVDYCDIEAGYSNKFAAIDGITQSVPSVCEIPFQMFAYKLVEKEKTSRNGGFPFTTQGLPDEDDLHVIMQNNGGTRHRRLACSEVMDRNDLGIFSDQRSVVSEIPHSKRLSSADQISILSDETTSAFADTPDWRLLSGLPNDHPSAPFVERRRRKSHHSISTESSNETKSDRGMSSKTKIQWLANDVSRSTGKKHLTAEVAGKKNRLTTIDPKPASNRDDHEAQEKISSTEAGYKPKCYGENPKLTTGVTTTPFRSESTRKKFLSNMKTKFRLTKIPEKKMLSSINHSSSTPEDPQKATTLKPTKSKLTLKNAIFNNSLKSKQNEAGTSKCQSPGASPARVIRTNSLGRLFQSPLSSPVHPLKASSPARATPTRSFSLCPSPIIKGNKRRF